MKSSQSKGQNNDGHSKEKDFATAQLEADTGNLSSKFLAELLCPEGMRAEPHTLENLVIHQSQKFWLSCDCPYVGAYAKSHTLKNKRVAPLP